MTRFIRFKALVFRVFSLSTPPLPCHQKACPRGHARRARCGFRQPEERPAGEAHLHPRWHLPGGGVERRESVHDALVRELGEEAGIALAGTAELFGLYVNARLGRRDHVAFYVCRDWKQVRPPPVPNVEILDCRFFPLAALPADTTEATRRRLAQVLEGALPSPEW